MILFYILSCFVMLYYLYPIKVLCKCIQHNYPVASAQLVKHCDFFQIQFGQYMELFDLLTCIKLSHGRSLCLFVIIPLYKRQCYWYVHTFLSGFNQGSAKIYFSQPNINKALTDSINTIYIYNIYENYRFLTDKLK